VGERENSMTFNFQELAARDRYKLLISTVVPRPIAWVTSVGPTGVVNAAPFSFFNAVGSDPALVVLGVGNREIGVPKDSAANIRARGEFVVNLVNEELAERMNICAVDFPAHESEIDAAGLQLEPGVQIHVPYLVESPVSFECREYSTTEIGRNRIIIGEVLAMHIKDEYVDPERLYVNTNALHLIGRMGGGGGYTKTRETFEIPRMSYEEWQAKQAHPEA
jgi:flavin reductase (DIM6/NTAB) family NADH-FMN oxidoreductase RutF